MLLRGGLPYYNTKRMHSTLDYENQYFFNHASQLSVKSGTPQHPFFCFNVSVFGTYAEQAVAASKAQLLFQ